MSLYTYDGEKISTAALFASLDAEKDAAQIDGGQMFEFLADYFTREYFEKSIDQNINNKYNKYINIMEVLHMTTYKNFKITAKLQGAKVNKAWGDNEPRNKYFVYVTNTETGAKTRFTLWDSLQNTKNGVVLDSNELLAAFYFFVSDAITGMSSFSDFCSEFGYDEDSRSAERTHKACERALLKFVRVSGFLYDDEIIDFANELQEIAG